MDEIILLNRVRVDIGNVSGSLSELMQYATLKGFNDNYEPQEKPRLVGTWTVNDWYISEQLTQARNTFDGLTIIENNEFLIDFNNLAVQTLDSTQPNYNPAVAIILHNNGIGNLLDFYYHETGGKYFLTKSEAAAITSFGRMFYNQSTVTDVNRICGTVGANYTLTSADLSSFTSIEELLFSKSSNLTSVEIASGVNLKSYLISSANHYNLKLVDLNFSPNGNYNALVADVLSNPLTENIAYNYTLIESGFVFNENVKILLALNNQNDAGIYGGNHQIQLYRQKLNEGLGFYDLEYNQSVNNRLIGNRMFANVNYFELGNFYVKNLSTGTIIGTRSPVSPTPTSLRVGGTTVCQLAIMDGNEIVHNFKMVNGVLVDDVEKFQFPVIIDDYYKIGSLTYQNCTNFSIWNFVQKLVTTQNTQLNQINVTLPLTMSGSIADLISIVNLWNNQSGENSNLKISGNYTVNDASITIAQCEAIGYNPNGSSDTQTITKIYGLSVTIDRGTLIVLQSYDPNADGYNPAVCIILEQAGYGSYIDVNDKTKGWFMTQTQASSISNFNDTFKGKTTVSDVNGIVGVVGTSYNFTSFIEFKYFTGITLLSFNKTNFYNTSLLSSIEFPNTLNTINTMWCSNSGLMTSGFNMKFPDTVSTIGGNAFRGVPFGTQTNYFLTFYGLVPPNLNADNPFYTRPTKIYVPAEAIDSYKSAANWSSYASIIEAIPSD